MARASDAKVPIRPLAQFLTGFKKFYWTNLSPGVVAVLISAVVTTVIQLSALSTIFWLVNRTASHTLVLDRYTAGSTIVKVVALVAVAILVISAVFAYLWLVIGRLVITGSRGHKESLGAALRLVTKRFPKALQIYLLVIGVLVAGVVLISLFARIVPVLGGLLALAGFVAAIFLLVRLVYVPFIIVDNPKPGRSLAIIRRSADLWSKSVGAVITYWLLWLGISIIISSLSPTQHKSNQTVQVNTTSGIHISASAFKVAIGATIFNVFLSSIMQAVGFIGQAAIYNEARRLLNKGD